MIRCVTWIQTQTWFGQQHLIRKCTEGPDVGNMYVPDSSRPGVCIPDAPVSNGGCPLLMKNDIPAPPANIDCGKVCQEYEDSQDERGIELGFTCDATLCTSECNDRDLVGVACTGLQALEGN